VLVPQLAFFGLFVVHQVFKLLESLGLRQRRVDGLHALAVRTLEQCNVSHADLPLLIASLRFAMEAIATVAVILSVLVRRFTVPPLSKTVPFALSEPHLISLSQWDKINIIRGLT